jgi:hypothetical protein
MVTMSSSFHFSERVIEAVRLSGSVNIPQSIHASKLHCFPCNQRRCLFPKSKLYAPVAPQNRGGVAERLF